MKKLPVISILTLAINQSWNNRRLILTRCGTITLIAIVLTIFGEYIQASQKSAVFDLLNSIIWYVWFIVVAVNCHRIFLLGLTTQQEDSGLGFSKREWRFLGATVLLGTIAMILMLLVANLPGVLGIVTPDPVPGYYWFVWILPAAYVVSRLSLMLPACAIDAPVSIAQAWQLTANNSLRLLMMACVLPVIFGSLADSIIQYAGPLVLVLNYVLYVLTTVIEISILSYSYRFLVSGQVEQSHLFSA